MLVQLSMVKSYLRYLPESPAVGLISSPDCNAVLHRNGLWAISPARQHVHVFHLQQGERLQALEGSSGSGSSPSSSSPPSVRRLLLHPVSADLLSAGYSDGSVRLFSLASSACLLTLRGHSAGISSLCFSSDGSQLFSGSQDTSICCWDVLAERGRVRLRGHRDAVTGLALLERAEAAHHHLVSCGKDGQLRVWDLHSQHCLQTLQTGSALWSLAVDREERCLLTGGAQQSVTAWSIRDDSEQQRGEAGAGQQKKRRRTADGAKEGEGEGDGEGEGESADSSADVLLRRWGELRRRGVKRVISLSLSADGQLLIVHSADRLLELFAVRDAQQTEAERRRRARRSRKRRERKRLEGGDGEPEPLAPAAASGADDEAVQVDDAFSALPALRVDRAKVLSVSCCAVQSAHRQPTSASGQRLSHRLLLSLADNSLALYGLQLTELRRAAAEPAAASAASSLPGPSVLFPLLHTVEQLGHRSPIRALSLSSDGRLLLTASSHELKLWALSSGRCIRTLECGAALCCLFVPGDRHAVVGTKAGDIEWFELGSAACLGKVAAHGGSGVFCMDGRANGSGFSTGGGDRTVRCWEYELRLPDARDGDGDGQQGQAQAQPQAQQRQLSVVLSRSLTLSDDVLCLRHSPDGRFLAVGLLDSTVRVFHLDSLRFSLALYGHRLPVIALDWASDSQLIASGSADKNVKLWGMAFGDCQASLFAHADSVTALRWLRGTHHVVSAGKDGMVRVWDADARALVQELAGHEGELWALGTGGETGSELIVSAGSDRSIRLWRQSEQLLFPEEERERRLSEQAEDARAGLSAQQPQLSLGAAEGSSSRPEVEAEMVTARLSSDSLTAGERLMEAIDIAVAERETRRASAAAASPSGLQASPAVNPFLLGLSPSAFVLASLSALPLPALDDCLLLLPFAQAVSLLSLLADALEAGEAEAELETCATAVVLLLQLHEPQIVSQKAALADLKRLRAALRRRLRRLKGLLGRNRAALSLMQQSTDV